MGSELIWAHGEIRRQTEAIRQPTLDEPMPRIHRHGVKAPFQLQVLRNSLICIKSNNEIYDYA